MILTRARLALWTAALAALAACGTPPSFDVPPVDSSFDDVAADTDANAAPEDVVDAAGLGRVCQRDQQCDDAIACTDDRCAEGRCVNVPRTERCDDSVYCNGAERCDRVRGCVQGEPINCNDNYVCTADRCVEATRTCEHRPLDRDGDGDPDDHCQALECGDAGVPEPDSGMMTTCWRGGDCDDANPRVSSRAREICGDNVDNNCNGRVDMAEPGGCMSPPYDVCADALDVSRGGAFEVEMGGLRRDYTQRCGGTPATDAVARFRLTETRDVQIEGNAASMIVTLSLQTVCGATDPTQTLECHSSLPAVLRRFSLPPGEYFILIGASTPFSMTAPRRVDLTVTFSAPTPPPTNDTCATAQVLPGPGVYMGATVGLRDDYSLACNGGGGNDAVFEFTTTATHDVTISSSLTGFSSAVALVPSCGPPLAPLRCSRGAFMVGPSIRARSLPPGTYRIIVETGTPPTRFSLTLAYGMPTVPPPEDACPRPEPGASIDLADGMRRTARTAELDDDYMLSCNPFGRANDAVYRLTVDAPSDLTLTAEAASGQTYLSLRNAPCAGPSAERRCLGSSGTPANVTFSQRNVPAGTYWVFVENTMGADVNVRAVLTPPAPRVTYTRMDAPPGVAFVDVCAMPTARRTLARVDDSTIQVPEAASMITIPFPLRMYGVSVTPPFSVSSNGWISLTRTGVGGLSGTLPSPTEPNLTITPYWTDLMTRANGVCYAVLGTAPNRQFVVQWGDVHYCCTDDPMVHLDFEAIINEAPAGQNNVIDFVYRRMDGSRPSASAGIENDDGMDATTVPPPFTAPRAVRFTPSPP